MLTSSNMPVQPTQSVSFILFRFLSPQYCLLAALLFYLLPGDVTYVAVAGLFLTMKVIGGMLIVVVVVVVVTDC